MAEPRALQDLVPMASTLGIEIVDAKLELVVATMAWAPERCTAGGVLHGGALMALADTAGAICAFLNLPEGAVSTTTADSQTNFLRAVTEGEVRVESRPLRSGGTLAVIESLLLDDAGRLVAKTTQTQIFLRARD
ncbi:MAG: PaaI family thioesterase [Actinobacteria bacterium]|nr:PaaI family thioesterase [Actinomycetota bacterium]